MRALAGGTAVTAVILVALALAACGPSAGLPAAVAAEGAPALHPGVAANAGDGYVFEYH